ncbi:hypothetical protein Mal64_23970 [Pseudobythopirellula maris]|uniref:Prepilin-type N-terminal cleavage/methylation domain-containing protein n=1 Tax=Pseudobythopirellula maris TaxID=2527991 RepID=A0A5C5ZPS0_9BACT|nr:hypothetical protein [Pseudobythopirellula maris]TWT88907.1 hypothetical protein Mal64_23970 [Pseudobythopirellula maris]
MSTNRTQRRQRRAGHAATRRGYTLAELLVASSLGSTLVVGLTSSLYLASQALDFDDGGAANRLEANAIVQRIARDARTAVSITELSATEITLIVPDRDGDGSTETVRYAWGGEPGDPLTEEYNGGEAMTLVAGVQSFDLGYAARAMAGQAGSVESGVTYESFTEGKIASNADSVDVLLPSDSAAGDLLIAAASVDGDVSASLAISGAGWTPLVVQSNSTAVTSGVWWKTATGAEPSTYTVSWSGGQQAYAWVMRFTGQHATTPINATGTGSGSASLNYVTYSSYDITSPAVTTTADNCLILRLVAMDDDDITADAPGLTGHATITMDSGGTGSSTASGGAGYTSLPSAGSSGNSVFEINASEQYYATTIAIAPAEEE